MRESNFFSKKLVVFGHLPKDRIFYFRNPSPCLARLGLVRFGKNPGAGRAPKRKISPKVPWG